MTTCVLPADFTCCETEWDTYTPAQQDLALLMAQETLRMLTAYRVGNCPVTLRPCRKGCPALPTWLTFPVQVGSAAPVSGAGGPFILNGQWYNFGCGCSADDCDCSTVCEVVLPGEVASIDSVMVDGATLDPSAYRVDNSNRLVRIDGACWPLCQNMTAGTDQPDTFAVTYTPGVALDAWGKTALGTLACEYARAACGNRKCRLPANVTQVTRQGVTLDLTQNPFPGGLTGIREVDTYVRRYNPYALTAPSVVWSPDVRRGRVTTIPAGT